MFNIIRHRLESEWLDWTPLPPFWFNPWDRLYSKKKKKKQLHFIRVHFFFFNTPPSLNSIKRAVGIYVLSYPQGTVGWLSPTALTVLENQIVEI